MTAYSLLQRTKKAESETRHSSRLSMTCRQATPLGKLNNSENTCFTGFFEFLIGLNWTLLDSFRQIVDKVIYTSRQCRTMNKSPPI